MLLSQKWLQEFVELDVTPREFANTMAMTGFCIGGYEREGDEIKDVVVGRLLNWLGFVIWVRRGKSDVGAIKSALKALKGKEKLLIFPEGTRHEEIGEGKTGAAMMAIRTGVPVLPVYIAPERTPFHRTKVYIGEPYQPFTENRRATAEDYEAVTEEIMDHIRAVRDRRAEMEARG